MSSPNILLTRIDNRLVHGQVARDGMPCNMWGNEQWS